MRKTGVEAHLEKGLASHDVPEWRLEFGDDGVQIEGGANDRLLPADGEELSGNGSTTCRRAHDGLEMRTLRAVGLLIGEEYFGAADNDRKEVVECVSDPPCQPARRLERLRLAAPDGRFCRHTIGHIDAMPEDVRLHARFGVERVAVEPE